jgi:hypothetical protein
MKAWTTPRHLYQIHIINANHTGLESHYGPAEGLGRGRLTGNLPDDVVTDSEAIEVGRHLQVMLREEWARFGRKGRVPEVEVVRVLWKGEGRERVAETEKVNIQGQGR